MPAHPAAERAQKLLSGLGLASRREAEAWIRAGRLTINGRTAALGDRVARGDELRLDGRLIRQPGATRAWPVLLCHRSPGIALLAGRRRRSIHGGGAAAARGPALREHQPAAAARRRTRIADARMVRSRRACNARCAAQGLTYSLRARGELSAGTARRHPRRPARSGHRAAGAGDRRGRRHRQQSLVPDRDAGRERQRPAPAARATGREP